jgi:hypothetical protein
MPNNVIVEWWAARGLRGQFFFKKNYTQGPVVENISTFSFILIEK